MKTFAILSLALLSACGPNKPQRDYPVEVCAGKLTAVSGNHLRMACEDGRVVEYTSYKYDMTVK